MPKTSTPLHNTRYASKDNLYKTCFRTNTGKRAISATAVDLWQELTPDFKRHLRIYLKAWSSYIWSTVRMSRRFINGKGLSVFFPYKEEKYTILEHRRCYQSRILLFKCMKGNGPVYISDLFEPRILCYNIGSSIQDQMMRLPGFLQWWNRQKPKHATDRTQTRDEEWWRQQSHCWAPFKDETSNWLGLCDMYNYNVFCRLINVLL